MLPVVICEPDAAQRARWMDLLDELARREYPALRMELTPGTDRELRRALETYSGVMLVLLSVAEAVRGGVEGCIELFSSVMERNRESYVLLCLNDAGHLDEVLSRCMRPAGVLLYPPREELMRASLRRVLDDYASLHESESDGRYMVVTSGGTVSRVAYRDILYLEAQNKLLNICLRHQVLTVRGSLNELEQTLPEDFLRCHRSYIVNRSYIERFHASEMMLELSTQERLPVSRSCKSALREFLKGGGWA